MEFSIRSPERMIDQTTEETTREYDEIRSGVVRRSDAVRQEFGSRMFDLLTEYFPDEYAARRRSELSRAFGAGVVVGLVGGAMLGGRFGRNR